MTAPDPGPPLGVVVDQRKRLGIVNYHQVVVEMVADGVIEIHLLVQLQLLFGRDQLPALEGVVHLLGNGEEIGGAVDNPPAGLDSQPVHKQRPGGHDLGHPAAGVSGVHVHEVEVFQRLRLLLDPLHRLLPDERLIVVHSG